MNASLELTEPGLFRTTVIAMKQWRIFVLWLVLTLIPTALVAIPLFTLFSEAFDHSVYATAYAEAFHIGAFTDLFGVLTATFPFDRLVTDAEISGVLLLLLVAPFLNGTVIASAQANRSLGFSGLIQGGFALYGRMIRVTIWSLVPFGIVMGIFQGISKVTDSRAEKAILESDVTLEHRIGMAIVFLLLLVVHVSIEGARAQYALDPGRRSAILAWWRSTRLMARRPVAVIGSYFLIELLAIIVVALLAVVRINVPHAHSMGFWIVTLAAQFSVVVIAWMQVARLLVLTQLTRETARRRIDAGMRPD